MSYDIYGNPLQRGHCEVHLTQFEVDAIRTALAKADGG